MPPALLLLSTITLMLMLMLMLKTVCYQPRLVKLCGKSFKNLSITILCLYLYLLSCDCLHDRQNKYVFGITYRTVHNDQ